ncbi:hypothetical protein GPECTOR_2g1441 [Gonium pectorale]|uniref:U-box domain-containing protein n=1 Tax=Gonium pectorale TaxID=33097 RepID=A0A150H2T5_GONPE|nr:hypothetical protein GPECTOR_2g1441 [Gonium pectorale]|eukprot:KXZ55890.1 hypothetical protein GPECTOR_2g1441 [Gonium pectorale]
MPPARAPAAQAPPRPPAAAAQAPHSADGEPGDRNGNASTSGTLTVQQRPAVAPMVLSAVGRVVGTAWSVLKLCNRYILVPAVSWGLQTLKAYLEQQLAIQRAMARTCHVPKYGDAEVRQATDDLGFTRRAVGTPYGIVSYRTSLRGAEVAVRQAPLNSLEDVDVFWAEEAAGRAFLAGGRHPHVVPYLGCCPSLACHVYEHVQYTCSLRESLLASSPHAGSLASWEARLALCQQLVAAVVYLARCDVGASGLSAANVIVRIDPASGHAGGAPQCWLAPACGFRAPLKPSPSTAAAAAATAAAEPGQRGQGQPAAWPLASGSPQAGCGPAQQPEAQGEGIGRVAALARSLGRVLMQVLAGADSPAPSASAVIQALSNATPTRLLAASVTPPLTDGQTWPLLAAVYPLMEWGRTLKTGAPGTNIGGGGGACDGRTPAGAAAAFRSNGGGSGAASAAARDVVESVGGGGEDAMALQAFLLRELSPALAELQVEVQSAPGAQRTVQRAAGAPAAAAAPLAAPGSELMEDPVVAADGHSYERDAISQWLAGAARSRGGRATSPMTGAGLPHTSLTPNYTLRSLIRDWRERHHLKAP